MSIPTLAFKSLRNPNICDERKLIFIHNPKAAGKSFRKWLGFDGRINHGFPSYDTPVNLWDEYTVVACVREPIERALSLYKFMTHESYQGTMLTAFPDIHSFDPLTFFTTIMVRQRLFLARQYKYTHHFGTNKEPDYLLKVEDLDVSELASRFNITEPFPWENSGKNPRSVELGEDLYWYLVDHFKADYFFFGYRPKSYEEFMDTQLEAA